MKALRVDEIKGMFMLYIKIYTLEALRFKEDSPDIYQPLSQKRCPELQNLKVQTVDPHTTPDNNKLSEYGSLDEFM